MWNHRILVHHGNGNFTSACDSFHLKNRKSLLAKFKATDDAENENDSITNG